MKKLSALVMLCQLTSISCKSRAPRNDSSELQGDNAQSIVMGYFKTKTKDERVAAILKRMNDLNLYTSSGVAATSENCPIAASDPCSLLNIFIEFETPGSNSVGHTGIALSRMTPGENVKTRNDSFFDYGPGTHDLNGKKVKVGDPGIFSLPVLKAYTLSKSGEVPGTQWWDNQFRHAGNPTPSEIGIREIIGNIDKLAGDYTVIRIPICLTRAHAELIRTYWVKAYMDMPPYRIPGNHCTSMAAQSFEETLYTAKKYDQSIVGWTAAKLDEYVPNPREINRWITSPTDYAERVLSPASYSGTLDYRHQCGSLSGQNPRAIAVKTESLYTGKLAPYVHWRDDRSIP